MLFIWHVEFQQHTMRRLWSCLQGFVSVSRQAFDLWHHGLLKLPRVHLRRTCSKDKTKLYQTFASATSASARRVTSSTSAVLVIAIVAFVQASRTNSSPRPMPMFPRPPGGIPANTATHKAPKLSRHRFFATAAATTRRTRAADRTRNVDASTFAWLSSCSLMLPLRHDSTLKNQDAVSCASLQTCPTRQRQYQFSMSRNLESMGLWVRTAAIPEFEGFCISLLYLAVASQGAAVEPCGMHKWADTCHGHRGHRHSGKRVGHTECAVAGWCRHVQATAMSMTTWGCCWWSSPDKLPVGERTWASFRKLFPKKGCPYQTFATSTSTLLGQSTEIARVVVNSFGRRHAKLRDVCLLKDPIFYQ